MDLLKWYEKRSAPFWALVGTVMPITGLFFALAGSELGAIGAILCYMAGWLSRHTQNPKAGNLLDPDRHSVEDYHK